MSNYSASATNSAAIPTWVTQGSTDDNSEVSGTVSAAIPENTPQGAEQVPAVTPAGVITESYMSTHPDEDMAAAWRVTLAQQAALSTPKKPTSNVYGVHTAGVRAKVIPEVATAPDDRAYITTVLNSKNVFGTFGVEAASVDRSYYLIRLNADQSLLLIDMPNHQFHAFTRVKETENPQLELFGVLGKVHVSQLDEHTYRPEFLTIRGDAALDFVARRLGLPSFEGIVILSRFDSLVLAHYRPDADMAIYGGCRGVVVDLEANTVVANSFSYTPTCNVVDQLDVDSSTNEIVCTDDSGHVHRYAIPSTEGEIQTHIHEKLSGRVVRVFLHRNIMHISTHRTLYPDRFFYDGKSMTEMYYAAGGPTREQLFGTEAIYSAICYVFFVVDPVFIDVSRQIVKSGYMVLLFTELMYKFPKSDEELAALPPFDRGHLEYKSHGLVLEDRIDNLVIGRTINFEMNEPKIVQPHRFLLSRAQFHLQNSYFSDSNRHPVELTLTRNGAQTTSIYTPSERQQLGGSLIIYKKDTRTGKVSDIIVVTPESERHRAAILGAGPRALNLRRRFVLLAVIAEGRAQKRAYQPPAETIPGVRKNRAPLAPIKKESDLEKLLQVWVPYTPYPPSVIKSIYATAGRIDRLPELSNPTPATYGNPRDFLLLIWLNLLAAAPRRPIGGQEEALTLFDWYLQTRAALVKRIQDINLVLPAEPAEVNKMEHVRREVRRIILAARTDALRDVVYREHRERSDKHIKEARKEQRMLARGMTPAGGGLGVWSTAGPAVMKPATLAMFITKDTKVSHSNTELLVKLTNERIESLVAREDGESMYRLLLAVERGEIPIPGADETISVTTAAAAEPVYTYEQLHETYAALMLNHENTKRDYDARLALYNSGDPQYRTEEFVVDMNKVVYNLRLIDVQRVQLFQLMSPYMTDSDTMSTSGSITPSSAASAATPPEPMSPSSVSSPGSTSRPDSPTRTTRRTMAGFQPNLAETVSAKLSGQE